MTAGPSKQSTTAKPARVPLVDLLRGLSLWAMAGFHFTWDLAHFGWIDPQIVASSYFHWLGDVIAVSFLLLVGYSLVLARQTKGMLWVSEKFWRRWAQVAAAAGVVSVVSYWLFPRTPIFFGILHAIALSSLIAAPLVDVSPVWPLLLGALALIAPHFLSTRFFDAKIFWWTGLSTFEPPSNDYRPLLPWLAFVLFGVVLGLWRRKLPPPASGKSGGGGGPIPRALTFCGRHSLPFYLIHQPILFGLFLALGLVVTPPPNKGVFLRQCAVQCVDEGATASLCEKACACMIERAEKDGFWTELARGRLTPEQKFIAHDEAVSCYAKAVGE